MFWPYSWGTISFASRKLKKIPKFQAFRVRKLDIHSRNHTSRSPLATKLWETSSNGEKHFSTKFQDDWTSVGPTCINVRPQAALRGRGQGGGDDFVSFALLRGCWPFARPGCRFTRVNPDPVQFSSLKFCNLAPKV